MVLLWIVKGLLLVLPGMWNCPRQSVMRKLLWTLGRGVKVLLWTVKAVLLLIAVGVLVLCPSSFLLTRAGAVEMHALDLSKEPPEKHVARVVEGESDDLDYQCACLLAEMVDIDLKDG